MPAPIITKPNQHFDALTYAGSASNQTISGLNFQPDFIWFKERTTNGIDHNLFDSQRSNYGSRLISNATNNEAASGAIVGVSSTGYSLLGGVSTTNDAFGRTYVTWNWKAGGAAVTNTSGSISSQVSANPTAGFSIFTFNSGASGTQTVGHGLGAYPGMVIFKDRGVSGYWSVWHSALSNPAQSYMYLDLLNAEGADASQWSNTAPTSSVFTYNSGYSFNTNRNMLAYAWAPVAGYSAFGKYTGNGSTDGPFIFTGFRPRFVLIKASSISSEHWYIVDATRSPYNAAILYLSPNDSDAETSPGAAQFFDFLSNGFKLRVSGSYSNSSGATYIYMAFAESPFKFSNAR